MVGGLHSIVIINDRRLMPAGKVVEIRHTNTLLSSTTVEKKATLRTSF